MVDGEWFRKGQERKSAIPCLLSLITGRGAAPSGGTMKAKLCSFTTGTDKLRIEGSGPPGLVDSEWWIVDGSERDKERRCNNSGDK